LNENRGATPPGNRRNILKRGNKVTRNEVIFDGKPPHLAVWKANFKALVLDHLCRIKSSLHPSIKLWLSAL
jgi:hypothetical protein